jgi:putative holliday junction resolvase
LGIVNAVDLGGLVAKNRRLIGLDLGSRTIGVALSDVERTVATPLETIRRTRFSGDAEHLCRLIATHDVGGIVIGLPVSMDGREGPRCQSVRQFARNLLQVVDLPMGFWDERLSTAAVERMLITEADMSRKRRGCVIDKLAAAYILQGALDAIGRRGRAPGAWP